MPDKPARPAYLHSPSDLARDTDAADGGASPVEFPVLASPSAVAARGLTLSLSHATAPGPAARPAPAATCRVAYTLSNGCLTAEFTVPAATGAAGATVAARAHSDASSGRVAGGGAPAGSPPPAWPDDDPRLWDGPVAELFLAPSDDASAGYYHIAASPRGGFHQWIDAWALHRDPCWDCPLTVTQLSGHPEPGQPWRVRLEVPVAILRRPRPDGPASAVLPEQFAFQAAARASALAAHSNSWRPTRGDGHAPEDFGLARWDAPPPRFPRTLHASAVSGGPGGVVSLAWVVGRADGPAPPDPMRDSVAPRSLAASAVPPHASGAAPLTDGSPPLQMVAVLRRSGRAASGAANAVLFQHDSRPGDAWQRRDLLADRADAGISLTLRLVERVSGRLVDQMRLAWPGAAEPAAAAVRERFVNRLDFRTVSPPGDRVLWLGARPTDPPRDPACTPGAPPSPPPVTPPPNMRWVHEPVPDGRATASADTGWWTTGPWEALWRRAGDDEDSPGPRVECLPLNRLPDGFEPPRHGFAALLGHPWPELVRALGTFDLALRSSLALTLFADAARMALSGAAPALAIDHDAIQAWLPESSRPRLHLAVRLTGDLDRLPASALAHAADVLAATADDDRIHGLLLRAAGMRGDPVRLARALNARGYPKALGVEIPRVGRATAELRAATDYLVAANPPPGRRAAADTARLCANLEAMSRAGAHARAPWFIRMPPATLPLNAQNEIDTHTPDMPDDPWLHPALTACEARARAEGPRSRLFLGPVLDLACPTAPLAATGFAPWAAALGIQRAFLP